MLQALKLAKRSRMLLTAKGQFVTGFLEPMR